MKLPRWLTTLERLVRSALLALLRAYRFFLSPWIGQQCRFWPTCSNYASEAIEKHGTAVGAYLATKRLLRCHPWCAGGHDPVPEQCPGSGLFNKQRGGTDAPNR